VLWTPSGSDSAATEFEEGALACSIPSVSVPLGGRYLGIASQRRGRVAGDGLRMGRRAGSQQDGGHLRVTAVTCVV